MVRRARSRPLQRARIDRHADAIDRLKKNPSSLNSASMK
jgi:hypothetical protein